MSDSHRKERRGSELGMTKCRLEISSKDSERINIMGLSRSLKYSQM